ncbi:hypothetical protein Esti_002323 [Eimeria stiedai]
MRVTSQQVQVWVKEIQTLSTRAKQLRKNLHTRKALQRERQSLQKPRRNKKKKSFDNVKAWALSFRIQLQVRTGDENRLSIHLEVPQRRALTLRSHGTQAVATAQPVPTNSFDMPLQGTNSLLQLRKRVSVPYEQSRPGLPYEGMHMGTAPKVMENRLVNEFVDSAISLLVQLRKASPNRSRSTHPFVSKPLGSGVCAEYRRPFTHRFACLYRSGPPTQAKFLPALEREAAIAQVEQALLNLAAMWQQSQPGVREAAPPTRHRSPQQQKHPFGPEPQQQQISGPAMSSSSKADAQAPEGRNLLRSLTFHRVLYVSEAYTSKRYNAGSNMLRKNYENFVLLKHKQALVTPGPKKAKDFPRGLVIAYPSGHIVSAATRQHLVGLAPQPEGYQSTVAKGNAINNTRDGVQMYADWIRRKFRSHDTEPPCATNGHTRFLNFLTRADLPQPPLPKEPLEVFLEEFHDFLKLHFPHWTIVYDPEVSPVMAICRLQKNTNPADAVAAAAAALSKADKQQQASGEAAAAAAASASAEPAKPRRGPAEPPTGKLQRRTSEDGSVASGAPAEVTRGSFESRRSFIRGRLMLPLSQQPKHLWPPQAKVRAYCRKEWLLASAAASSPGTAEAAAAMAELQVVLLVGAAHIVAHCRSSAAVSGEPRADCIAEANCYQAATSAAVSDIWSLLRYFVGTGKDRFFS